MKSFLFVLLTAAAVFGASPFEFEEIAPGRLQLNDNGRPVYVYNYGVMRPAGVPEARHRCCYVHPVYTPGGIVITDDFPVDHYHHRGVFWVWPKITVDGTDTDLWLIDGVRKKFGKFLARETLAGRAVLEFTQGWYLDEGDEEIVRETVRIVALPASGGKRALEFTLGFEALSGPVEITGQLPAKGYGGFSVRFAPRHNTVITTKDGEVNDSNMVPYPWAREEGGFKEGRAALRIDIDPSNPGYPNGWCLRHYGFLGVNFPGLEGHTLRPGEPLSLKYKLTAEDAP